MVLAGPALAQGASPSWSGFYIGGNLGGGWSSVSARDLRPGGEPEAPPPDELLASGFFSPAGTFKSDQSGIVIGGQIGAQYQWDRIVIGAEASLSGADLRSHFASPFFPATDTIKLQVNEIAAVVGRIGYTFDRWMIYVKAGYAGGNVTFAAFDSSSGTGYRQESWQNGWTAGGGGEYLVAKDISLGLDYAYIDLGGRTGAGLNSAGNPESFRLDADIHTLTARVNFKLGR
jgi:outer membrane immunogenic protein